MKYRQQTFSFSKVKSNLISAIVSGIILIGIVTIPTQTQAQNRPGSTSADFLNIGVSARGEGMGGSYISIVEGAESNYYNPAALTGMDDTYSFYVNHTSWFAGINHEFVSASYKQGYNAFGASVTALYTDEMNVTTPTQPSGTGETFYSHSMRANVNYARQLTGNVSLGIAANFINIKLYEGFQEQAYSVDIATEYRADYRDFRFAMKIANLGSEIQFVNESYPLPVVFVFGTSINAVNTGMHKLVPSITAAKPNDGKPTGDIGLEYSYNDLLFLRGGYNVDSDFISRTFQGAEQLSRGSHAARFSTGAGVKLDFMGQTVSADYSFSKFHLLGYVHRIGMSLNIK